MSDLNYEISADIPFYGRSKTKWPFFEMKEGDSVLIKTDKNTTAEKIKSAAYNFGRIHKRSVRVRLEGNDVRVWVIK